MFARVNADDCSADDCACAYELVLTLVRAHDKREKLQTSLNEIIKLKQRPTPINIEIVHELSETLARSWKIFEKQDLRESSLFLSEFALIRH